MDSIIDEGMIEDSILLDYDFDDFLRSNSSKECTDSVNFRIRKSYYLMSKFLVNLWLIISWLLFNMEISLLFNPFYVFLVNYIGIGDFSILNNLTWVIFSSNLKVFKGSSQHVPCVAWLFIITKGPEKLLL